jgi:GntR family transcriptional regulator
MKRTETERLPLLVTADGHEPIYLQIAHQIKHFIVSRRLEEGARLPSVREVARQLGVNVNTVVQAYRTLQQDGLVDSTVGRGTVVNALTENDGSYNDRQALMLDSLTRAVARGRALGFGPLELRQAFGVALNAPPQATPAVLIAPTEDIGRKYAAQIHNALGSHAQTLHPFTLEQLETGYAPLVQLLEVAYHVVTFTLLVPATRRALDALGVHASVLGITAEPSRRTLDGLHNLPERGRYALVTEERNVATFLSILQQHSRVDHAHNVRVILGDQVQDLQAVLNDVDTVLYSLGVRTTVERAGVDIARRFELEFEISQDSLYRLHTVFNPTALAVAD